MSSYKYAQLSQEEIEQFKRVKQKELKDSLAKMAEKIKEETDVRATPKAWARWATLDDTWNVFDDKPKPKEVPLPVALFLQQRVKGTECPLCKTKGQDGEVHTVYGDSYSCISRSAVEKTKKANAEGRPYFSMPFVHSMESIEVYLKDWANVPAEWGETGY